MNIKLNKFLCGAGLILAVVAISIRLAGCNNKEKAMEQRQAAFEDSLLTMIREHNIPMIQVKYTAPKDSVYCQVGVTPWSKEEPVAIVCNGSTFWKCHGLVENVTKLLDDNLKGASKAYYKILKINDDITLGTAFAAINA